MNKTAVAILCILVALGALIAVLQRNTTSTSVVSHTSGTLNVVASFYPVGFFAEEIGGDKATVTIITPAGSEPHDYEPTAEQMAAIQDSNLLILNGHVEPWADKAPQLIDATHTTLVVAGDGLQSQQVTAEGQTTIDPHVWLSPVLATHMVDSIEAGFEKADAAHASYYQANALALKAKLAQLDMEYRNGLAQCASKDIITSHAAFGYLASAYGLTQIPIAGLSPDAEPSPQQLASIVDIAKKNHVTTIFFESLVSPKLSQTIADEIGAKTAVLDPIEGVANAGALDSSGRPIDYFGSMRNNLHILRTALVCTP
jgi:zinc transport system substrate-binding protein